MQLSTCFKCLRYGFVHDGIFPQLDSSYDREKHGPYADLLLAPDDPRFWQILFTGLHAHNWVGPTEGIAAPKIVCFCENNTQSFAFSEISIPTTFTCSAVPLFAVPSAYSWCA